MRRAVLFLACAICGMSLLCVVGLPIVWLGETNAFVLPDAADVRIDVLGLTRQRIAYQLPPNRTLNGLFWRLEQYGWTCDTSAEQILRRDRMENLGGAFAVFWRHDRIGPVLDAATIVVSSSDARLAEIRLSRCFAIVSWTRCL